MVWLLNGKTPVTITLGLLVAILGVSVKVSYTVGVTRTNMESRFRSLELRLDQATKSRWKAVPHMTSWAHDFEQGNKHIPLFVPSVERTIEIHGN